MIFTNNNKCLTPPLSCEPAVRIHVTCYVIIVMSLKFCSVFCLTLLLAQPSFLPLQLSLPSTFRAIRHVVVWRLECWGLGLATHCCGEREREREGDIMFDKLSLCLKTVS